MALKMDLHIHSTYSDGTLRPVEIVKKYHQDEYSLIALTDHDGIGGVREAQIAAEAVGLEVMTGIEFSTVYSGGDWSDTGLHILGYQFDLDNGPLNERLQSIRRSREERNQRLLALLQSQGIDLTEDDLKQRPDQTYIGKPNFALAMVEKGIIAAPSDAFRDGHYLESPEARRIKKERVTSEEAINLIRGAGGIPVLAHPMKIKGIGEKDSDEFWNNLGAMLKDLRKKGLGGLECFHPSAEHEQALHLTDLAGRYHLHITQGSDYHGPEFE